MGSGRGGRPARRGPRARCGRTLRAERTDLRLQRGGTNEIGLLQTAIHRLGGYQAIRACGEPVTVVEFASLLAWDTRLDVGSVAYLPGFEKRRRIRPSCCQSRREAGGCNRGTPAGWNGAGARTSLPPTC